MIVTPINDAIAQQDRSFQAVLINPIFGAIGEASSADVTITDNDSEHTLIIPEETFDLNFCSPHCPI